MAQSFDIPIDVPWKLVAVSPDMMDVTFCDQGFPPPWRSSLAIYAYEPAPGDVPQQLCDQKVTYLKVTCSVTGFQPTPEETKELSLLTPLQVPLPGSPVDVPEDLVDPYFACYGVLLNVAVFPSSSTLLASNQYTFDGKPTLLPNPFSDGALQFTETPPNSGLHLLPTPGGGPLALAVESRQLQIDLPTSRNVVLQMSIASTVNGTVTAYQDGTSVFSTPLTPSARVTDVPIRTASPVTRIIVNLKGAIPVEGCLLAGLRYETESSVTLDDYPHIIDFEPKTRDLYQAATDQGEILTASKSEVNTGKSFSNAASSEMGLGLNAKVGGKIGPVDVSVGGDLTSKWGNTTTDSSATQIDQSRERRETQGTTTNITQQYNVLTGYHAGTEPDPI